MATIADIAFIQGRLIALFPNYHPADLQIVNTVWLEILGDLPADLLKMAIMQYSSEAHDFAPSAGTVRDYAMRIQIKSAGIPDAYQAYDEVCKMPTNRFRSWVGEENGENVIFRQYLEFSHPLIERVAIMLGWPQTFPTDNSTADRAQFIKAYDAQLSQHVTDTARLPIVQKYIERESQKALSDVQKLTKQLEGK